MEDSLADTYYDKLLESESPVSVLVAFYCKLIGVEQPTTDMYAMITKLYKIYGARLIFFSLLDCVDVPDFGERDPIALISYFAKKRMEKKVVVSKEDDLRLIVKKYQPAPRKTPLKIGNPFEEDND